MCYLTWLWFLLFNIVKLLASLCCYHDVTQLRIFTVLQVNSGQLSKSSTMSCSEVREQLRALPVQGKSPLTPTPSLNALWGRQSQLICVLLYISLFWGTKNELKSCNGSVDKGKVPTTYKTYKKVL